MHSSRLVTALLGALLSMLLLGASPITAANTRIVCFQGKAVTDSGAYSDANCSGFGSGDTLTYGKLTFSPVTAGGSTAVNVLIRNDSGSTLNHVRFAGGDVADQLPYNSLFNKPDPPSLPDGVAAVFPSKGCTLSAGNAGFLCDVGSLRNKAYAIFTVVIKPSAANGQVWFTSSWNEGWSTTGSNADYAFAVGDIAVSSASCDTGTANYFLPADNVLLNGVNCLNQLASISAAALGGNGGYGSVGNDPTPPSCPTGLKVQCYGTTVSVVINGGLPVAGGVQWSITWYGIKSLSGVIHYKDNYSPSDPTTYDVIYLTKSYQCGAKLKTNCWQTVTTSKGNTNPFITVVFVTPANGKGGGFF